MLSEISVSSNENDPVKLHSHDDDITCDCTPMSKVPDLSNSFTVEATSTNLSKKCEWLLKRYSASIINAYSHKPLPQKLAST